MVSHLVALINSSLRRKAVKLRRSEVSRTREREYKRYFQALNDELHEVDPGFPKGPVSGKAWCNFAPGASWGWYSNFFSKGNRVGVCVYIEHRNNREMAKATFDRLEQEREVINGEFGEKLEWKRLDHRNASRINLCRRLRTHSLKKPNACTPKT